MYVSVSRSPRPCTLKHKRREPSGSRDDASLTASPVLRTRMGYMLTHIAQKVAAVVYTGTYTSTACYTHCYTHCYNIHILLLHTLLHRLLRRLLHTLLPVSLPHLRLYSIHTACPFPARPTSPNLTSTPPPAGQPAGSTRGRAGTRVISLTLTYIHN